MVLAKLQPYNDSQGRPVLNTVIMAGILVVILLYPLVKNDSPAYGKWAPFIILGLLCLVLIYSTYYLMKEVRQKWGVNKVAALEKSKGKLF